MSLGKWIGLFSFLVSLYVLWRIRNVLLLLFVAIVLAVALNRLVQQFQKFRLKRSAAVALAAIAFIIFFSGFVAIVIPPFVEQLQKFVQLLPNLTGEVREWLEWIQKRLPGRLSEDVQLLDLITQQGQSLIEDLFNNFFTWISDLLSIAFNLILILILTIMLLAHPEQYRRPFVKLFPAFYRPRIDEILTKCEVSLSGWITGTLISISFVSVLSGLSLWILGVPLVLANSLWAGFTELIPNVGSILGMIPPLAIALIDAPWKVVFVAGIYFLIQQLQIYIVVPWVMKEQVALPPAVTLLSQIVFTTFFGVLGLFLALPLMVVTKICLQELLVKDILDHWRRNDTR